MERMEWQASRQLECHFAGRYRCDLVFLCITYLFSCVDVGGGGRVSGNILTCPGPSLSHGLLYLSSKDPRECDLHAKWVGPHT